MTEIMFKHLKMSIQSRLFGRYLLNLAVDSGIVSFTVDLPITYKDYLVIKTDGERASFLQAALHQPFQLQETRLGRAEQRRYLDAILHAPKNETEEFLAKLDRGRANGAIANMLRITSGKDSAAIRNGEWFAR